MLCKYSAEFYFGPLTVRCSSQLRLAISHAHMLCAAMETTVSRLRRGIVQLHDARRCSIEQHCSSLSFPADWLKMWKQEKAEAVKNGAQLPGTGTTTGNGGGLAPPLTRKYNMETSRLRAGRWTSVFFGLGGSGSSSPPPKTPPTESRIPLWRTGHDGLENPLAESHKRAQILCPSCFICWLNAAEEIRAIYPTTTPIPPKSGDVLQK